MIQRLDRTELICRFDDPLDAVAVHGGGGIVGVVSKPFLAYQTGIFWTSEGWHLLGANMAGLCAIALWSGVWSLLIFGGLKAAGILRIDRDTEFRGNDMVKHGEAAYPVDAWVRVKSILNFRKPETISVPRNSNRLTI